MADAEDHDRASARRLEADRMQREPEDREFRERASRGSDGGALGARSASFLSRTARDAYLSTSDSLPDRLAKQKHTRQRGDASSRADRF